MKKRARLVRGAVAVVAALTIGVLVVPAGAWFDTQDAIDQTEAQLLELTRENKAIQARVDELSDRDNIERQARDDFGLAMDGDEAYALPAPAPITIDLPNVWPFNRLEDPLTEAAR